MKTDSTLNAQLPTPNAQRRTAFDVRGVMTKDDWLTPPDLLARLGGFDLDPCAAVNQPWATAIKHYTAEDDGLIRPWFGRVFVNPPYSTVRPWMKRLAEHGNGIALVFARTETRWFFESVWGGQTQFFFYEAVCVSTRYRVGLGKVRVARRASLSRMAKRMSASCATAVWMAGWLSCVERN